MWGCGGQGVVMMLSAKQDVTAYSEYFTTKQSLTAARVMLVKGNNSERVYQDSSLSTVKTTLKICI